MFKNIIRDAIIGKNSLTAQSPGGLRRFSPHTYGRTANGTEVVVGFEYAPEALDGIGSAGDWCIFDLDDLSDIRVNDDAWVGGAGLPPRDHLLSLEVWAI